MGDSTFFASGLTGVVNAAYNDHDITICVLDNSTTAMTGMQAHPGTGTTLMGAQKDGLSIPDALEASGIRHEAVFRADPLDMASSVDAVAAALSFAGPSAVIFESLCIWLSRAQENVEVDVEACTGCKRCITEIGCPAISFDAAASGPKSGSRGQARVDAGLCTGCALCVQVCPFGALVTGGER